MEGELWGDESGTPQHNIWLRNSNMMDLRRLAIKCIIYVFVFVREYNEKAQRQDKDNYS